MYWSGVFSGLTVAAIGVLVWSGAQLAAFRAMYAEFGAPLPLVTEIALHPGFQWGAPAAFAVALAVAGTRKQKPASVLAALAILSVGAAIFQYWAAHFPLYEVSAAVR